MNIRGINGDINLTLMAYDGTSAPRRDVPHNKGLWTEQILRI